MTSKVAKKIALSISKELCRFTCLEGSVIGVAVHIMLMEFGWRRVRRQSYICGPTRVRSTIRSETSYDFLDLLP